MKDSHIQWTDNTFNGWEGCSKVSPGCANCYAENRNARFGGGTAPNWGPGKPRRRTSIGNWNEPRRWNRLAMETKTKIEESMFGDSIRFVPPRVFSFSLADWLDYEVPIEWLADFLTLVFDCGFLDWQLLTKRPENFRDRLLAASREIAIREQTERNAAIEKWIVDWVFGKPPHNVWVGTSVEDQERADLRIPQLLAIPAVVRFLSAEPLLGNVEFSNVTKRSDCAAVLGKPTLDGIQWVIVGGESGPKARRTNLNWIESIVRQCRAAKVACFVKQLGAKPYNETAVVGRPGSNIEGRLHLRHPKGGDPSEWHELFHVFEFPEVAR